jgi:hypothetical protein
MEITMKDKYRMVRKMDGELISIETIKDIVGVLSKIRSMVMDDIIFYPVHNMKEIGAMV